MNDDVRRQVNLALAAKKPEDAVAHVAEWVSAHPDDRDARMTLAILLGDAGHPAGALDVLRALSSRLAHQGFLLAAIVVIKKGLDHAPNDANLLDMLKRLHVRGQRAKAGDLPIPPPLGESKAAAKNTVKATELLALSGKARLERVAQIGVDLGPAGDAAIPLPMPLFCELDHDAFVEIVRRMHYGRVVKGTVLLKEGAPGESLLIVASGHVRVSKDNHDLAKLGPGMVIGEIALITGAPRSATVEAHEDVEYLELDRKDIEVMAKQKPQIAEELLEFCRKRLIGNLLNTSPLFKHFDDATRYTLLDLFARKSYQPGHKIIKEGEVAEGLFVIAAGDVQVVAGQGDGAVKVATLKPGDVFGEASCLTGGPAGATVSATSRVGALVLDRNEFQRVVAANPKVKEYLNTLASGRIQATNAAMTATDVVNADDLVVS
ncbi:MAG: cyclic nucleotide-binding domain-containing protein [Deltaproteobacteria bacterium]|nr:cyclic nucleotide-binding domain-containing protein [Deltaproteobacteria bacterium]